MTSDPNDPNDPNDQMTESFADDWLYGIFNIVTVQFKVDVPI